jgi:hypothetical protein
LVGDAAGVEGVDEVDLESEVFELDDFASDDLDSEDLESDDFDSDPPFSDDFDAARESLR